MELSWKEESWCSTGRPYHNRDRHQPCPVDLSDLAGAWAKTHAWLRCVHTCRQQAHHWEKLPAQLPTPATPFRPTASLNIIFRPPTAKTVQLASVPGGTGVCLWLGNHGARPPGKPAPATLAGSIYFFGNEGRSVAKKQKLLVCNLSKAELELCSPWGQVRVSSLEGSVMGFTRAPEGLVVSPHSEYTA